MAVKTNIAWCDCTHNHWIGCTGISPACDNCYAEAMMDKRMHRAKWGAGQPRSLTGEDNRKKPLKWNKDASQGLFVECICGHREFRKWDNSLPPGGLSCCSNPGCNALPESECDTARPRVFCSSLSDVFDNEVPIEWLVDLLDTIRRTPYLDWLLLTKRVGNVVPRLNKAWQHIVAMDDYAINNSIGSLSVWLMGWLMRSPPANVSLGSTICNQFEAYRDIPKLLDVPARVRFLSIEPILSSIDLDAVYVSIDGHARWVDWVIVGGESGANARSVIRSDWVRLIKDQCAAAGVAFLFKQWGCWLPDDQNPAMLASSGGAIKMPKEQAGRLLDGVEYNGFPRVRA